jgi:hypothetical protein
MFVTSFIPLWATIIFIDVWEMVCQGRKTWKTEFTFLENIKSCISNNMIQFISVLIIFFVVIVSIISIEKVMRKRGKANNDVAIIKKAHKESFLSTQYLLSYILPLVAFDFGSLRDIIIFLLFFAVLAFLCIRNNNVYTNIYLELRSYKIYTCDIQITKIDKKVKYEDCFVLSKVDLTQEIEEELPYWEIDTTHYINTKEVKK